MRTKADKIHSNRAHIQDAVEQSGSVREAITMLREAGFSFRRSLVVDAFQKAQKPGLDVLDWPSEEEDED